MALVASLLFMLLAGIAGWLAWNAITAQKEADQQRVLTEAAEQEAKQAQREADEARKVAHIDYLSTSGLLAAHSPNPYAGDWNRAALLVRQAEKMAGEKGLPKGSKHDVRATALSNLRRINQVIGHLHATWPGHGEAVISVDFSPDGRRVVSGSKDDPDNCWDSMLLHENAWKRACSNCGP